MAVLTCDFYSKARIGHANVHGNFAGGPPARRHAAPAPTREGPWPTLYLLHGYTGNQVDWLYRSDIEKWAMQHGYAVIMPSGGNSFYLDNETTGERYGVFIGEELVEVTRKMFPLSHKREDTVIAGLSMGGYGAIRNGLRYAGYVRGDPRAFLRADYRRSGRHDAGRPRKRTSPRTAITCTPSAIPPSCWAATRIPSIWRKSGSRTARRRACFSPAARRIS